jgi:hypothetical protein
MGGKAAIILHFLHLPLKGDAKVQIDAGFFSAIL